MEKYIEQLKPLFEKVAEKIGQGANFGWEVVLRQQVSFGIIAGFLGVMGLVMLLLGIKLYREEEKEYADIKIAYFFMILIGGVGFVAGTINAILRLSNPAYYALQFFLLSK